MEISIKNNEYKSKFQDISQDSVEIKLLNHFIFLKDENKFNKFYSEFDIEEEDKIIINMWEEIINYIYEEIFNCMILSVSDLKQSLKINNKFPSDFKKIIQYLIYTKKYIKDIDLKNENFYINNFPNLYHNKGYFSNLFYYISYFNSKVNFCKSGDNINDDDKNDEDDPRKETSLREDLGKNYLSVEIPENAIIINYKIFKNHCNAILFTLNDILSDEGEEIIIKNKFIDLIEKNYIDINLENGKLKLNYGLQLINEALFYLKHTKQIIIFKINENNYQEFIKVAKNKDDCESEEDKKIAIKILKGN